MSDTRIKAIYDSIKNSKEIFDTQNLLNKDKPYVFYEGPPFATGTPHYGHILNGIIKDTVCRWKIAEGYNVPRNAGWDCHGLPIENKMEDKFNIKSKPEIINFGIDKYNKCCKNLVFECVDSWKEMADKIGRWIDFENDYKTMSKEYMECVWNVFKRIYDKDMVYRGFRVMPYSCALSTPLSNFEASSNYKDTTDICATVKFKLITSNPALSNTEYNLLVWTTTPWTLPSNSALAVNKDIIYIVFTNKYTGINYISSNYYYENNVNKEENLSSITITGESIIGSSYTPVFNYNNKTTKFTILNGNFVSEDKGTGIVHIAPSFGEDDFNLCIKENIINKDFTNLFLPVDENGKFTNQVSDFKGKLVFETNDDICRKLKDKGLLYDKKSIIHSYPYCWRSDTKLMYRAVDSWFIKVSEIKDNLVKNNQDVNWVPDYVGKQRFNKWLENARDWNFSRKRYWGCTIPIWVNTSNSNDIIVIGSIEELEKYSGYKVDDLHRDTVDKITFEFNGNTYKRIEDVMDCWFESGSMPYAKDGVLNAQLNQAEFICEGLDQTRGWFYTLLIISTILDNKAPYKNVIVNGLVLAEDGKKMSKRLNNYPDPIELINKYGSDSLRFYLLFSNASYGNPVSFKDSEVKSICSNILFGLFNSCKFYNDYLQVALKRDFSFDNNQNIINNSSNISDIWIKDLTLNMFNEIKTRMDKYELKGIGELIKNYVDKLNNTYIRFNRNRFRDCDSEAIYTLNRVLYNLSIILSPFMPFISQYIYSVTGNQDSVHLKNHTDIYHNTKYNSELYYSFEILIELVENIRKYRTKNNLRSQIPIKSATVFIDSELFTIYSINRIARIIEYFKEECNILDVKTVLKASLFKVSDYSIDYKTYKKDLGVKVLMEALNDIKNYNKLKDSYIDDFGNKTVIKLGKHIIRKVNLNKEFIKENNIKKASGVAIEDSKVYIKLDTELDKSTLDLYYRNQLLANIQQFRKLKNYSLEDLLTITLNVDKDQISLINNILPESYQNSYIDVNILDYSITNDFITLNLIDDTKINIHIKGSMRKDSLESICDSL